MIREEGLGVMTGLELQNANVERGMRSVGVSVERLRNQLEEVSVQINIGLCVGLFCIIVTAKMIESQTNTLHHLTPIVAYT